MDRAKVTHELVLLIENCYLKELTKNYDECDYHGEYQIRLNTLENNIVQLRNKFDAYNFKEDQNLTTTISLFILLYHELRSKGRWNVEETKQYANDIDKDFKMHYGVPIETLLKENNAFHVQNIFQYCLQYLHNKLTSERFKKFPSFIDVYCSLMDDISKYKVKIKPLAILPASLLLIEDYIPENKNRGLMCCKNILKCLEYTDFVDGNYYEVLYATVTKELNSKDLVTIMLVHECTIEILRIIPEDMERIRLNELLVSVMDDLFMESNFYRKDALLKFLTILLSKHKTDTVKRKKKFMRVICDNFEICVTESIRQVLFNSTLKCLEVWLKYCWCVWQLKSDIHLLNTLFKLLYVLDDNEIEYKDKLQNIIVLLIKLNTKEEQKTIMLNMEAASSKIKKNCFLERVKAIESNIIL